MQKIDTSRLNKLVTKIMDPSISVFDYEKTLKEFTPDDITHFEKISGGRSFFHCVFNGKNQQSETKMRCLFKYAIQLNINPNMQWNLQGVSPQYEWNNTPLHFYLANELFELAQSFLRAAKDFGMALILNLEDREGKSALMLAIKLGNAPVALVNELLSEENYNKADNTGVTPIMMACAMRRVDIIQSILQIHAKQLDLGLLNFDYLTKEQKQKIADFINQQDKSTGKSLAHFAVMRCGTETELIEKAESYQLTVVNVAKSVGIDARRDKNAEKNSPENITGAPIIVTKHEIEFYNDMKAKGNLHFTLVDMKALGPLGLEKDNNQFDLVITPLTYFNEKMLDGALLASKRNAFLLASKQLGQNSQDYGNLKAQIKSYSGISYSESILSQTKETLQLLDKVGHNFSLKQKSGNKTAADYLTNLMNKNNEYAVTDMDKKYLFDVVKYLEELTNKCTPKLESNKQLSPGV